MQAPLLTLRGHTDPVHAVAVSPDGRTAATGSFDRAIKLWELASGKEIRTFAGPTGHQGLVLSVAFAPDGKTLASGGVDNAARLWDVSGATPPKPLPHPNIVDAVAFSPDGSVLATACHDGLVRLFDPAKAAQVREIKAHASTPPSPVYAIAFSPDGKTLASASYDRSIKLWEVATGSLIRELKPGSDAMPVPVSAGAVIGAVTRTELPATVGHRDQVFCVAFTKDGQFLASGSSDRTVKVWDVSSGRVVREMANPNLKPVPGDSPPAHPGFVHAVRFSGDGKTLLSAGTAPRNGGYLAAWDVSNGKPKAVAELPIGSIYALELLGDGGRLLIGCGPADRARADSEAHVIATPGR